MKAIIREGLAIDIHNWHIIEIVSVETYNISYKDLTDNYLPDAKITGSMGISIVDERIRMLSMSNKKHATVLTAQLKKNGIK